MNEPADFELLWKVGYGVVALTSAFVVARQQAHDAMREGKAANRRLDQEEDKRADLAMEFARFRAESETRVAVLEVEVLRLRDERHKETNWLTGKLGILEHEVDVLKDEKA